MPWFWSDALRDPNASGIRPPHLTHFLTSRSPIWYNRISKTEGRLGHFTDDFEHSLKRIAETRRQQDLDDYNHEISGVDVGRIGRFLSSEARLLLIEQRTGKASKRLTALDLALLNNAHYAKIYTRAMDELHTAEQATESALEKALKQSDHLKTQLSKTMHKAKSLPSGSKVFKDKHGTVWSENNKIIEQEEVEEIEWSGTEPSYETYLDLQLELEAMEQEITSIREYQTDVLGSIRGDLTDSDEPKSEDEIEKYRTKIKELMPKAVKQEMPSTEIKIGSDKGVSISIPKLD